MVEKFHSMPSEGVAFQTAFLLSGFFAAAFAR